MRGTLDGSDGAAGGFQAYEALPWSRTRSFIEHRILISENLPVQEIHKEVIVALLRLP